MTLRATCSRSHFKLAYGTEWMTCSPTARLQCGSLRVSQNVVTWNLALATRFWFALFHCDRRRGKINAARPTRPTRPTLGSGQAGQVGQVGASGASGSSGSSGASGGKWGKWVKCVKWGKWGKWGKWVEWGKCVKWVKWGKWVKWVKWVKWDKWGKWVKWGKWEWDKWVKWGKWGKPINPPQCRHSPRFFFFFCFVFPCFPDIHCRRHNLSIGLSSLVGIVLL